MEKKRFILFGTYTYYPSGGMDDAITSFDDNEYNDILKEYDYNSDYDYYHIFDTKTFRTYKSYKDNRIPKLDLE